AAGAGARRGAGEMEGGERESGAERPGDEPQGEALECRQPDEIAAACAARPQEGEVAPVALGCAKSGEVGEPERDQRAGNGKHDVERLSIERVAGRAGEAVGEIVDEHDLARELPLDAVAELCRLLQRLRRAAAQ